MKGRVKTFKSLTDIVNKKYKTNFQITQIIYQVNKLMKNTFGNAQEDANLFVKLSQEKPKEGAYFNF